jgi:hypothetical protein
MKKYTRNIGAAVAVLSLGASGVVALGGGTASAQTTTTTTTTKPPATPASGGISNSFVIDADTATISGETPAVNAACSPTNTFQIGQTVLFRLYGEFMPAKSLLLANNTKSVTATFPGATTGTTVPVTMNYSSNDGWWTGVLLTTGYAAGNYNYSITVVTNPVAAVTKKVNVTIRLKHGRTTHRTKTVIVSPAIPSETYVWGTGGLLQNEATVTLVSSL